MHTKAIGLLLGIVVAVTMVQSANAATYVNCYQQGDVSPTWHVFRPYGGTTTIFYAAKGEVVIRQLHGCTNSAGQGPWTGVMAANMANPNPNTTDFPQVAYGMKDTGTGMGFWATVPAGGPSGNMSLMSIGIEPIIGNTVRFEIYGVVSGPNRFWRLKVSDLTRGASTYYGYRDVEAFNTYTNQVWYGIEDHNTASQFGGNSSANQVRIRNLSYRLTSGGAWTYLTGTPSGSYSWANANPPSIPACWQYSISTYAGPIASDQTSLNGWTSSC